MSTTDAIPAPPPTAPAPRRAPPTPAPREDRRRGERVRDLAIIAIPAALAAGLCFYELSARSLWLDESATVAIASQHGAAFGAAVAHDGGNMLGYYALLHVLIGLFGKSAFLIRAPSALAAAATVAIVGTLALRIAGRRAAIASGSLAAVSLSLVYWGQDARGYALMIALISASFLALVALLQPGAGWRPWVAYAALIAASVYAGLEAALVVPAQLVVLFFYRDRARAVLSAAVAAGLCCVPLAVLAAERGSSQLFWVPPPTFRIARQVAQALASSGLQPSFYTTTGTALLILTGFVLVLGLAVRFWPARRRAVLPTWAFVLMVSWLLVPAALALLESTVGQSVFQARYLLVSLPAVALLLGLTLADRRIPRLFALVLLAALIVLRALQLIPAYGVSPENWRAATAYVTANARAGDCSAFYPLDNRMPFQYYLPTPGRAPRAVLPAVSWRVVRPFVEDYSSLSARQVEKLPAGCKRVWLVASHEGRVGGPPVSSGNFTRFLELTATLGREYPLSSITSFGYHGAVTVTLFTGAASRRRKSAR